MSSGMWYRTLVYLGLKEEPEEGYDDPPEQFGNGDDADPVVPRRFDPSGDPDLDPDRRRSRRQEEAARTSGQHENVRPLRVADGGGVRPLAGATRLAVVQVERFDDVEEIGSRYRTDQPVLFDVSASDRGTARRVVDFVSGLTYALRGRMAKVGTGAFLLVPDGVELPDEEVRRLTALGYRLPEERS